MKVFDERFILIKLNTSDIELHVYINPEKNVLLNNFKTTVVFMMSMSIIIMIILYDFFSHVV